MVHYNIMQIGQHLLSRYPFAQNSCCERARAGGRCIYPGFELTVERESYGRMMSYIKIVRDIKRITNPRCMGGGEGLSQLTLVT